MIRQSEGTVLHGSKKTFVLADRLSRNMDAAKKDAAFFALWKDGDSDAPLLRQARSEFSRLSSGVSAKAIALAGA
jgi:hypothetical protein